MCKRKMEREQRSQGVREVNKEEIKSASAINQDASQEEEEKGKKNPLPNSLQVPNKSPPLLLQLVFGYIISRCLLIGGQDGGRTNTRGSSKEQMRPTLGNGD